MTQKILEVHWFFVHPGWAPDALLCVFEVEYESIQSTEWFYVDDEESGTVTAQAMEKERREVNAIDRTADKVRAIVRRELMQARA